MGYNCVRKIKHFRLQANKISADMERIRIKDAQTIDIIKTLNEVKCPMAVPFVTDEKHPSGFHLSEDESFLNKDYIRLDCAWKLRDHCSQTECTFSERFMREIKFRVDLIELDNK